MKFFEGLQHYGPYMPTRGDSYNYTYNGKENVTDLALNWLDYGARWYDAAIARWWAVDPLAEKYAGLSGYNYVVGNPVILIDPTGMLDDWIQNNQTGEVFWDNNVTSADQLETEGGYNPEVYSYIGKEYQLPDGSGSLTMTEWRESGDTEAGGEVSLIISWKFTPSNGGAVKTAQSFTSNMPDFHGSQGYPGSYHYQEACNDQVGRTETLVDGVNQIKDPGSHTYVRGSSVGGYMSSDTDIPTRPQSASGIVHWDAQATPMILKKGSAQPTATFTYGFSVYPNGRTEYRQPRIVEPSSFQDELITTNVRNAKSGN